MAKTHGSEQMSQGFRILDKCEIADKVVVVYNWDDLGEDTEPRIGENVVCYDVSGKKLWTVNGMQHDQFWNVGPNMFVGIRRKGDEVYLNSFRCSSYRLELETGAVIFHESLK